MTKSILLVGVGGQGTILASRILSQGLMDAGYDVKMSEIHGMSQRGGSVSSQIRYGTEVFSPVIEKGGADILVSFEKMEALRWFEYLNPNGKVVVNNYKINPMPVAMGKTAYPNEIIDELQRVPTIVIDAAREAKKLGNPRVMNIILLGTIVSLMDLDSINWEKILTDSIKPSFLDINLKALKAGKELVGGNGRN
jgi:indolepyruvate ferredoxin oxidoreductase beta subunit